MHPHNTAEGLGIEVQDDSDAQVLTVRLGPLNIPAHAGHLAVADQLMIIPFDGWLTGFYPRLIDGSGNVLPRSLLHHVDFFNTARINFLCPQSYELIFAAGSETQDWSAPHGIGYRAAKSHPVRIRMMFQNPGDIHFPITFLEVRIKYQSLAERPRLTSVYPAWFFVGQCGDTLYDLQPGDNVFSSRFTIDYPGRLLQVGGHLHEYGQQLILRNVTRGEEIARLHPARETQGGSPSVPVMSLPEGGHRLNRGDVVEVATLYGNPTGMFLPQKAMGIVLGVFLPEEDEQFTAQTTKGPHRLPQSPQP